jgi:hypothetical protein
VLKIKGGINVGASKTGVVAALLNAVSPLPYHFRAGRYQCFWQRITGAAQDKGPARWRAGSLKQSLNGGLPYAL